MLYAKKLTHKVTQSPNTRLVRAYIRLISRLVYIAFLLCLVIMFIFSAIFYHDESRKIFQHNNEKETNYDETERREGEFLNSHLKNSNSNKQNFAQAKIIDSNLLDFFKSIQRDNYDVSCQKLIEWDESETRKAKRIIFKLRSLNSIGISDSSSLNSIATLPDSNFIFNKSMCTLFKDLRGYNNYGIHEFELNFPLAFTILTYNNVEQFERLLRAIYRPQNVYCIHIDKKSSNVIHQAIESIAQCFDNVFISTRLERIVYAGFSRLKADLNCMQDLSFPNFAHPNLKYKNFTLDWKYLLNLASSEFPLRTNYELVKILHMFNGANDIEWITNFQRERVEYIWIVKRRSNSSQEYLVRTKRRKAPTSHNYTIVKGLAYCSFSNKFVKYVLTNRYAVDLLKWSEDTYSPDEW